MLSKIKILKFICGKSKGEFFILPTIFIDKFHSLMYIKLVWLNFQVGYMLMIREEYIWD